MSTQRDGEPHRPVDRMSNREVRERLVGYTLFIVLAIIILISILILLGPPPVHPNFKNISNNI